MQDALSQLPEELRETLLLVVVGELTHQEVANMLEIPLGTVLSRVSRARRRLRDLLVGTKT
jgi:RNA polymerase sigma-70 factor (ECF subfamily)